MKTKGKGLVLFLLTALITALGSCMAAIDSIDPTELLDPRGDAHLNTIYPTSLPDKQVYILNEPADWTGLRIQENLSTGGYHIVQGAYDPEYSEYPYNYKIYTDRNYTVSGFDSASTGEKTITFSKKGLNVSFTVSVRSDISAGTLVSLNIRLQSVYFKSEYALNEPPDWTGMRIEETYFDGTSRSYTYDDDPSRYTISGFDSSSPGGKYFTVRRDGVGAMRQYYVNED
jgi:hypothetical protein